MKLLESVVQKSGAGIKLLPPVDTVSDDVFIAREYNGEDGETDYGYSYNDNSFDLFDINPASGLPMIEGSCVDVSGNAYGTD